ncbi:hypothetical protein ABG768_018748 [Culter alburnus]|uniref:Uncharacterized protein n=1 Tax=Culter alburnus TaxID=194366 RepID=A0AAW2AW38_CULAL
MNVICILYVCQNTTACSLQKIDKDRRIISCLQCFRPQEMLPNHLLRVCMKNQTSEERNAEVERAKKSMKAWTLRGRTWDYNEMVKRYPDEACRQALLEDLRERHFLILNDPKDALAESSPPGAAACSADSPRLPESPQSIKGGHADHPQEAPGSAACGRGPKDAVPVLLRSHPGPEILPATRSSEGI